MGSRDEEKHVARSAGRAALYPARFAARVWRAPLESAADDVLAAPEIARILDRALAGSLPEELARSLVRHQVLERVVRQLAESGELERLITKALGSRQALELTDRVLASDEMQRTLHSVASSPELRDAVAHQSAGLAEDVAAGIRTAAVGLDERAERAVGRPQRPEQTVYAGIGSRAVALTIDALLALVGVVVASGVVALIGSLVGGIRPHWLVGSLLGAGWVLVTGMYFVLFWSITGQTPGMSLMHLRVRRAGVSRLSTAWAIVRAIGLWLAIIPLFAGFIPALFDKRRRALPDYLAGTVVVYDDAVSPEQSPG